MGDNLRESDFDSAFGPLFHDAFDVAYRILEDVDEAEDAAVDAMTRARLRWGKVGHLPYRAAWVMRAAANAAIVKVGSRARPPAGEGAESVDDDHDLLHSAVVDALGRLPHREREILALRYIAGVEEADVAACLGISVDSVKSHLLRAMTGLGDRVGRAASEAEPVAG